MGTSLTTGQSNVVVWNSIHHKTNIDGGTRSFGYPDDTYFNRVKHELAANGVCDSDIDDDRRCQIDGLVDCHINKKMRKIKRNLNKI